MNCKYFDPITASCAPCCVVCSNYRTCCHGEKKAAPVLAYKDGCVNQFRKRPSSHEHLNEKRGALQV